MAQFSSESSSNLSTSRSQSTATPSIATSPTTTTAHAFSQHVRNCEYAAIVTALGGAEGAESATELVTGYDDEGHTSLHWAAFLPKVELVEALLAYVRDVSVDIPSLAGLQSGQTPLHWAAIAGNVAIVRAFLNAGADPAFCDTKGYNAAIHAAQYGHVDVLHVLLGARGSKDVSKSVDHTGNCLVQWAAYYNHVAAVRYLTVVHALPADRRDRSGATALHRAAVGDHTAVAHALLRGGADPHAKDQDGRTALQLARPRTHTAALLSLWTLGHATVDRPRPRRHTLKRYIFVLFYYLLLVLSYCKYHELVIQRDAVIIPPIARAALHVFTIISVIAHVTATFCDPGDIARGDPDQFVRYIEGALQRGDSNMRLHPSAYCYFCLAERPPRSKHSHDRDVCVRRFDHECPWVNNSVGLRTHKTLLLLVVATFAAQLLFMDAMARIVSLEATKTHLPFLSTLFQRPFLAALILLNLIVGTFCFTLFVTHVRLIMRGVTTYEAIIAEQDDKPLESEYDFGICTNMMAFITSTGPGTEISHIPSMPSVWTFFMQTPGRSWFRARKSLSVNSEILPTKVTKP